MPSVLIIDDHLLVAQGTKEIFEKNGFETEMAKSPDDCRCLLNRKHFDLYILDWNLGTVNGCWVARRIVASNSTARIMIYTSISAELLPLAEQLTRQGICGIVDKEAGIQQLISSARLILNDYYVFSREGRPRKEITIDQELQFNRQEIEVIQAALGGETPIQIADQLSVHPRTVDYIIRKVKEKLKRKLQE